MNFSWIFILFIATAVAAIVFSAWSARRTRKRYDDEHAADIDETRELRQKAERGSTESESNA